MSSISGVTLIVPAGADPAHAVRADAAPADAAPADAVCADTVRADVVTVAAEAGGSVRGDTASIGAASGAGAAAGDRRAPLLAVAMPTPAGSLAVLLSVDGVVRAAGFAPVEQMAARLPSVLAERGYEVVEDGAALAALGTGPALVAEAVVRYADGELAALDGVPVEQAGGPFQQRAWQAMRAIAPGETVTYAELAVAAGSPSAVRAAGSACARNLIAPFVPCHRVLRSGGALGGYYYGLDVKRALLAHESRG